ncbi:MAG: GNAT family N-acetyltransferase [Ruminococcaceae bacterium]|nr:GNAT family N-acetyltransferase [Oscillospiraceae bacterium]
MTIDYPKAEQKAALRQLFQAAFGDSETFLDRFFATGFHPRRCRCITVDGHLAAALYWFDCDFAEGKIAYLYAVATDKSHRGKGLCNRLMADTHDLLKALGYAGAILVPGSESLFRFYAKMGYETISCARSFTCDVGESPLPMRQISAAEYAFLRRQLLPQNGVLQEGESLRFLESCWQLYAGDGWCMAATTDGDKLYAMELLGSAAAPGIVASMDCKSGHFRTPGGDPFAMYFPLCRKAVPGYFGLAFD